MGEEDEFEMLLGEIPYATSSINLQNFPNEKPNSTIYGTYYDDPSYHLNYTTHESPVSGFSFPSNGSSSSILSNSNDSLSPPLLEEIPSHGNTHYPNLGNVSDNPIADFGYPNLASELKLTDLMNRLCISNCSSDYRGYQNPSSDSNGFHFVNNSIYGASRFNVEKFGNFSHPGGIFSENTLAHPNRFQFGDNSIYGTSNICEGSKNSVGYPGRGFSSYRVPQIPILRNHSLNVEATGPFSGMNNSYSDYSLNQFMKMNADEKSLIMRGEGSDFVKEKNFEQKNSSPVYDIGSKNPRNGNLYPRMNSSLVPPPTYESLIEIRGYIPTIAKDQDGCRFLQRIFDEGSPHDMQIIFGEIIGHIVELMVDPFGNYLMQKLLEVCNEEQRMQILIMLTEKPGQLIRISLNTHGTRVVQKLIETLKTRQQVSLVISALEPGFLALIKDLNGNHVIKQCLQSLTNEDNKFIFVAASKYSIEVATHQHGCCVLQCCISLLTGKQQEKLVKEISSNGILLAQDEYGNFVIQYILELEIPSAKSCLISQFEGNFVHLSMQKFSSHVVEKCLAVFNIDMRSKIIHELLSASSFKVLLQDPYANYVIGKALKLTEGSRIYNVLVEAIQCHESDLRNSPYSKKLLTALKQYRETSTSRRNLNSRNF